MSERRIDDHTIYVETKAPAPDEIVRSGYSQPEYDFRGETPYHYSAATNAYQSGFARHVDDRGYYRRTYGQ